MGENVKETNDVIASLKKLREPFPKTAINTLPKPYKKDSPKGHCNVCGGYHGLPAAHLDYVGHAALTDRFLEVDPFWTWEPLALTEKGTPLIDNAGGMWIQLTICGVTRLGYGDSGGKTGTNATKELIGDALRNAGMRFGAALELWHKGDLPQEAFEDEEKAQKPQVKTTLKQMISKFDSEVLNRDQVEPWKDKVRPEFSLLSKQDKLSLVEHIESKQVEWVKEELGPQGA